MMQFEYMQVAHPFGVMQAYDLNAYGQQGWQLVAAIQETRGSGAPTGLTIYTFMRMLPPPPLIMMRPDVELERKTAERLQTVQPHEHEARASRKDPVVRSDALDQTDSEE